MTKSTLWWPNQIKASRRGCSRTCKLASRLAMVAAGTRPPRCSRRRSSAPWWASLCSDGEAPRPTENAGLETMWTRHAVDPQHRDELASAPMAKRQDRQKTRGWRRCGLGKRATGDGLGASGQFGGNWISWSLGGNNGSGIFFFTRRLIVIIGNCKHFWLCVVDGFLGEKFWWEILCFWREAKILVLLACDTTSINPFALTRFCLSTSFPMSLLFFNHAHI